MSEKYSVVVIVEGDEEECLFDIVSQNNGIHETIDALFVNANGAGNIGAFYQEFYSEPSIDCVVAVYDVDCKQGEHTSPFNLTRSDLLSILGDEKAVDSVSFCTNPNILQILLLGCAPLQNVLLNTSSKKQNSEVVEKYWPKISVKIKNGKRIKNGYTASNWQLDIIKDSFCNEPTKTYSYDNLLKNISELNHDYKHNVPGGNLELLLKALKTGDKSFFEKIKNIKGE